MPMTYPFTDPISPGIFLLNVGLILGIGTPIMCAYGWLRQWFGKDAGPGAGG